MPPYIMAFLFEVSMTFYKYKEEAKRLNQQDGLGDWKDRPLEYRGDTNGPTSKSTLRNTVPFSQRGKAKAQPIPEAAQPYPPQSTASTTPSNTEQHDTNSDRLGNNISQCTRQDSEGSSSKSRFVPFSAKHKRKG